MTTRADLGTPDSSRARAREAVAFSVVSGVVADYPLGDRVVSITGGPVAASLDNAKVERIVDNLVVNAAKHTRPEGGGASFHVLIPDCVLDVAATVE